jgi:hypothetical protein
MKKPAYLPVSAAGQGDCAQEQQDQSRTPHRALPARSTQAAQADGILANDRRLDQSSGQADPIVANHSRCQASSVSGRTMVPISWSTRRRRFFALADKRMRWSAVNRRRRGPKLLSKDTILGLEIVDHLALLLVDPAGHGDYEKLERMRNRSH